MKKLNILDFIDSLAKVDQEQIKRISDGELAFLADMCNNISDEAKRVLNQRKEKYGKTN